MKKRVLKELEIEETLRNLKLSNPSLNLSIPKKESNINRQFSGGKATPNIIVEETQGSSKEVSIARGSESPLVIDIDLDTKKE